MPSGSRARTRSPVVSSASANANMPRNRRKGLGSPGPPGLEHHLGVGFGGETDAASFQVGPQLLVVVQLAVVDEGQAVLGQRLVGGGGLRSMIESRR